jgi:hypothetical protein
MKAIDGLQSTSEFQQSVREFVKRSAASAKDHSADLHAGAQKVTSAIERVLVKAVSGIADANRKVVDAAYEDVDTALLAIDKLAGAKSFAEAYQIYVDYLRRQSEIGLTRAKNVADFVNATASEGFHVLRDGAAKIVPTLSRAA